MPLSHLSEAEPIVPQTRHQKDSTLSEGAVFLVTRTGLEPMLPP